VSYSNERTLDTLRSEGAEQELLDDLESLDRDIDTILRSGGTSHDVRPTQQRFNDLLSPRQRAVAWLTGKT